MITKLGMMHQAMEVYKVCIIHDPEIRLATSLINKFVLPFCKFKLFFLESTSTRYFLMNISWLDLSSEQRSRLILCPDDVHLNGKD